MRIIALLLLFLALGAAAETRDDKAELGRLLAEFLTRAADRDMHERFWSEDLVYTSSAGRRFGKADILEGMANDEDARETAPGPRYSAREVDIRVFDDFAVITFRLVATDGEGEETFFLNTGVFRNEDGQWRAMTWQATVAASP